MKTETSTSPAIGRLVIGSSGGSSGTQCLLIFIQAHHFIQAHQMLNHGVTHTYLMRNNKRSRIFTGRLSIKIKNNSMVILCSSVMRLKIFFLKFFSSNMRGTKYSAKRK